MYGIISRNWKDTVQDIAGGVIILWWSKLSESSLPKKEKEKTNIIH